MNNIDLKLNDIEGINVSLDVAVKKIEPPLEDLTEELNTYNTELTEQETIINRIIEALNNRKWVRIWVMKKLYKNIILD